MADLAGLLDQLWNDYVDLNPYAREVYDLLVAQGERVKNDHIALRTFDDRAINIDRLAQPFLSAGYTPKDHYEFPEKKLEATYFQHEDAEFPKVFISELKISGFSKDFQDVVERLICQMPPDLPQRWNFPVCGRPWTITFQDYERLRAESEYAAWVAAFGFRANHFTVNVNALTIYNDIRSLNTFLKDHGFILNAIGGELKGSPEVLLEQSSIMARDVPIEFADGVHRIPACYYEFAKRYPLPDGTFYQGFIQASADKIFESTYTQP